MSAENWTIFGEYPAPVKLEKAPQVISNYLTNQNIFVQNEKLVRVSDHKKGFIVIRVNKTWQLAKILGQISDKVGDFSAWAPFNTFFVLQLYEENIPSERVLAKLDDNIDTGECSAWETFHHLFTRTWMKTFVDRQNDSEHWANKFQSPTIVARGEPDLDDVFEEIDSFHKNQTNNSQPSTNPVEPTD